jgi:hexosaminidase
MKSAFLISVCALAITFKTYAQSNLSLVPIPESVSVQNGKFVFSSNTKIYFYDNDTALQNALEPLCTKIKTAAGFDLTTSNSSRNRSIIKIRLDNTIQNNEGYVLKIRKNRIDLRAKTPAGIFYGVQTILQLLPVEIEAQTVQSRSEWSVPCVEITDAPRFSYRGVMLDVARHYQPITFIKKLIDLLAMQKMNRLHIHLTDSQGWRFESKKYPKLTQIGAYRKGTPLNTTYDYNSRPLDSLYGGFYTQDELKDIVKYAAGKFITIIPEIEMPAHSKSALASYPEFACLDSTGHPFEYPQKIQDEYCTKDSTFIFLTDILDEVMNVFPSKYIHVAGDEAGKENWKTCKFCQQRMKDEGLKNVEELQSYFIKRIEKFVNSKGRDIIGWDEILQGGLAPNATVMSWTGIEGGIKAAKEHHNVIMTPGNYCYLDHYQSNASGEPAAFGGFTPLEQAYNYNPVPTELNEEEGKYIIGVQGNLWTENFNTPALCEYMIFPRAIALAETGWSKNELKNFDSFVLRTATHLKRLDFHQVNYSKHLFDLRLNTSLNSEGHVSASIKGVPKEYEIHYTLDGNAPAITSPIYHNSILIDKNATLTAAVLIDGAIVDQLKKSFVLHKAVGKPVTLKTEPSEYYNKGGNNAWVNGSFGGDSSFNDDEWLGWCGHNFEGTINFEKPTTISSLRTRFFHRPPSWIWTARKVTLETSDDGINFKSLLEKDVLVPTAYGASLFEVSWVPVTTKYLKIVVEPWGNIPKDNAGEGTPAWLFVDEMVVE